ncbi:MAG: hypothetical protein ABSD46_07560 [Bacteroidota bacterium]
MSREKKTRKYSSGISINGNVRCQRIYPVENSDRTKSIADLKTVGIKLTGKQAIHLATVLLAVSQVWDEIDITAWRTTKRADDTYQVTVTSPK